MTKEWVNKDRYCHSHGVTKPHMPLPKGKAIVHTVPAWEDRGSHARDGVLQGQSDRSG
jgi:hypothetical protein